VFICGSYSRKIDRSQRLRLRCTHRLKGRECTGRRSRHREPAILLGDVEAQSQPLIHPDIRRPLRSLPHGVAGQPGVDAAAEGGLRPHVILTRDLSRDALVVQAWHYEYVDLDLVRSPGCAPLDPAAVMACGVAYVGGA
jgi:hypothetical protein